MARKKKDKVDQVLDQVLGANESPTEETLAEETLAEETLAEETLAEETLAEETLAEETSESLIEEVSESPTETLAETDQSLATKETSEVAETKEFIAGNLEVSVAPSKAPITSTLLIWKGKQVEADMENFLRHKAHQFMVHYYGKTLTLAQIDQAVLDQCASDYRFMREIDKLTRNNP